MERLDPDQRYVSRRQELSSVAAETSIDDFRRYDISGGKAMRLAARCSASYSSSNNVISQLACRAPVADGEIALDGRVVCGARIS